MKTNESDFEMIPCDRLFARIEENLSSYTQNGLVDTEQFYPEIKWLISQFGLPMYEKENATLMLKDHTVELPCDFFLLDSAWLCCHSLEDEVEREDVKYWQGKAVFFTVKSVDTIVQNQDCPPPNYTGWSVSACNNNALIDNVTITEYVTGSNNKEYKWSNLTLLRLRNDKNVGKICSAQCRNLFYSSPNEISINRKGSSYYLTSTLKDPAIFIEYWRYPIDRETKLPLIPNDAIIEQAIIAHLTHWLLVKLWTNGEISNVENIISYWQAEKARAVSQAKIYCKSPSFLTLVNYAKTVRRRWETYESINSYHY